MRKLLFMALCTVAIGSCAHDGGVTENGSQTFAGVKFRFRTLTSTTRGISVTDTIPNLDDVRVHVFKKSTDTYLYDTTFVIDWQENADDGSYEASRAEMMEPGDYRFLGVGMDEPGDYTLPTLAQGVTSFDNMVATVATQGGVVKELFAGFKDNAIDASVEQVEILISRKVAGFLGYFQNVLTQVGGTPVRYLRLTASSDYSAVNLATGQGQGALVPQYKIIDLDLRSPLQDSVRITGGTWVYAGNTALDDQENTAVKLPNSQLVEGFAIPYSPATLVLGLYDAAGNPLRTWQIKSSNGNTSLALEPNTLFSLGQKLTTGSTDAGTPGNAADDDTPLDLSLSQIISVNVEGGWGNVIPMTLQPQQ